MKKTALALVASIVLLIAIVSTTAIRSSAQPDTFSPKIQAALVAAVTKELAAYGGTRPVPGAVVGVWTRGKGSWTAAIGSADIDPKTAMLPEDKFRIGSNTKTFLITVLLQLVDEQKLSLDDPLSKFDIGIKVPNAENITVRQLCQMRSGLMDAYNTPQMNRMNITPESKFTPQQLIGYSIANPPLFPPGTKWNYSNTNYIILGLIAEAITHHSIQDEINSRLLVPLALHNTTFPTENPDMPAPFSHGFALDADKDWMDATVSYSPTLSWAAGAMISDMADMKKWVKAYVAGETNTPVTQKQRLDCLPIGEHGLSFGLGIGCSGGWYGYTGGIAGYNTGAYYFPAQDATIIAFVNSQQEKPDPGVANSIVRDITQIVFPNNVAFPLNPTDSPTTK
jgi:D-alanyl-D-alanine carboxypeptidase